MFFAFWMLAGSHAFADQPLRFRRGEGESACIGILLSSFGPRNGETVTLSDLENMGRERTSLYGGENSTPHGKNRGGNAGAAVAIRSGDGIKQPAFIRRNGRRASGPRSDEGDS